VPAGQRDALVRALVREAEGSPLFLGELARYARERGPAPSTGDVRFGSVLAQRVATLSPAARALLEAICVAGHPIAPRIVSRAAAVGKEAPSAFIELTAGHFVRSGWSRGSEAVEAFHDRIRENVSNILAPAERAEWHRRLAEAMEHSSQPDPEHLAVHLEAAGESDRALAFVLEAADYAAEMLAFDRAAELAARGLALMAEDAPDRSEVEERLGTALAHGGRSAEAADAFLRAADLEAGPDRVLDLKRRGAEHLLRSGHVDRGVDVIREVLGSVGLSLGRSRPRVLRSLLWHRLRLRMRGLDFEERDAADVDRALLRRIDTAWSVSTGLALIDVAQGARFQARHLLLALQAGEPYRAGRGLALEAGQLVARGIKEEQRAKQLLDRAEAIAQRLDHAHLLALTTAVRGVTSVFLSRWRESLNRMTLAEQLLRERCTNVAWELATVMRFQLLGLFYLGDLEELAKRAPRMIADGESRGDLYAVECGRTGVAAIAWLVRDETEEAVRQLDDAAARWTDRTYHLQHFLTLQGQVLVDFYEGRPERSIERFDSQWADLTASHLLRVQYIRVQTYFHRGSAALAALPRDDARAAEERVAERMAAKLDAENAAFATAFAESLHAGLARRRGDDHGFRRYLIASERRFEELEMEVFRRATQLARARFVGGQEGQKLEAEVREALLDIGAKRPEAVCRAVLPGLVDGRC
jgi:tetratricopeptide (TPR) repeat protein